MSRVAVVTGAGSGVGRAVVHALHAEGWDVALIGRRAEMLDQTIHLAGKSSSRLVACVCDVASESAVGAMAQAVRSQIGVPSVLVNSAGTNVPRRSWAELSLPDYQRLIDVNLTGAYLCIQQFLPDMRRAGQGTIVNVVSDAGLVANAKAGVAYVAAKFGLRGLTQSLNAEERVNGIRACAILPGDVNTPILDLRPNPPPVEARARMLQPEDVAACVILAVNLPPRAVLEELLIRPR